MSQRSEAVHALCSRLAQEALVAGDKSWRPTVSLMRMHGIKGNPVNLQDDIHVWVQAAFQARLDADENAAPGVPSEFTQAFLGFLEVARAEARRELDGERQNMTEKIAAAELAAEEAKGETREAIKLKDATAHKLEATEHTVQELRQQISDLKASVIAKEERIEGMLTESAAMGKDYELRIQALDTQIREAKDARAFAMTQLDSERQERRTETAQLREQLSRAQENARNEREMADGFRTKAGNAETLLASTRSRADQAEQNLEDLRQQTARKDARIAELEAALASNAEHFREKLTAATGETGTLQGQVAELRQALKEAQDANAGLVGRVAVLEASMEPK